MPQYQHDAGEIENEGREPDDGNPHHRRCVHVGSRIDDRHHLLGEDEGEGEQRKDERADHDVGAAVELYHSWDVTGGLKPAQARQEGVKDRLAAQLHQRPEYRGDRERRERAYGEERRRHPLVRLKAQTVQGACGAVRGRVPELIGECAPAQKRPAQAVISSHVAQQHRDLERHEREEDQEHRLQLPRQDGSQG